GARRGGGGRLRRGDEADRRRQLPPARGTELALPPVRERGHTAEPGNGAGGAGRCQLAEAGEVVRGWTRAQRSGAHGARGLARRAPGSGLGGFGGTSLVAGTRRSFPGQDAGSPRIDSKYRGDRGRSLGAGGELRRHSRCFVESSYLRDAPGLAGEREAVARRVL